MVSPFESAISHRPSVSIYIPEQYGSVEQKTEDRGQMSEKTVILVKDAHCVYEAQTNISKILETLVRDYKIDLVCVEGAEGLVDTSIFSAYPDQKVRKKAADKYF